MDYIKSVEEVKELTRGNFIDKFIVFMKSSEVGNINVRVGKIIGKGPKSIKVNVLGYKNNTYLSSDLELVLNGDTFYTKDVYDLLTAEAL